MKGILIIVFSSVMLLAIPAHSQNEILVEKLFNQIEPEYLLDGKLLVIETKIYGRTSCKELFASRIEDVIIMTKEEAFMRGLTPFIEIEKVDVVNNTMTILKYGIGKRKRMVVE